MNTKKQITYLNAIIKNIENNYSFEPSITLFGGISGQALFLNTYNNLFDNEKKDLENKLFEVIINKINNIEFISYSGGLFGIIQMLKNTNNNLVRDLDLSELDELIKQNIKIWAGNYLTQNNYDYLHGFLGLLYVYSDLYSDKLTVSKLVNDFLSLSIENDIHLYWNDIHFTNRKNREVATVNVNFGLAHGLISYAVILAKCNKKFNLGIEDKIIKIINYYWDNKNEKECSSFFPNALSISKSYEKESRLSWCYGDVGIAAGFLNLSFLLKNNEIKKMAIQILLKTVSRKNLIKTKIADTSLCHGVSGLIHIYKKFYVVLGINKFNESYLYWMEVLNNYYESDVKFQYCHHKKGYTNNLSLLEGVSGTGLAILSTLTDKNLGWDECLLIS